MTEQEQSLTEDHNQFLDSRKPKTSSNRVYHRARRQNVSSKPVYTVHDEGPHREKHISASRRLLHENNDQPSSVPSQEKNKIQKNINAYFKAASNPTGGVKIESQKKHPKLTI